MVGRGALNIPNLSRVLKSNVPKMPWSEIQMILQKYAEMENSHDSGFYHVARIKQWLRYLNKEYDEANIVFEKIKTCQTAEDLRQRLNQDM
ncbi:tRNA-dihydrouridine synthase C [Rodentibacter pneumotropicus]|nr:tRNA-dihydrouridine synthase C [Rodentibacter pneumotropicus]